MKLNSVVINFPGDTHTPVGLYQKVRDLYPESVLLESSDYHSPSESFSMIGFDCIAGFELGIDGKLRLFGSGLNMPDTTDVRSAITDLFEQIELDQPEASEAFNGWFGQTSFETARYFEDIGPSSLEARDRLPLMRYFFFRHVLVFDHYRSALMSIENLAAGEEASGKVSTLLQDRSFVQNRFRLSGEESATPSPEDFLDMVKAAKDHCQRGDVFQLVLSRRFTQGFRGDEFAVYRALRSVNPSPYLFYFDFGDCRIFGSSPEAQLVVEDGKAEIHPIAGTFPRTGNDAADFVAARELDQDEKENSEHVMLVDLARNDLSRHCRDVEVKTFKEIQFFSHVIHLVSLVEGRLRDQSEAIDVFADTFPAGTLSGAPKVKALELIDKYEAHRRSFYGGAIGIITPGGRVNHAITIRSFLSDQGKLHFQAGAGIVNASDPEKELAEVNHKLAALRTALEAAQSISA